MIQSVHRKFLRGLVGDLVGDGHVLMLYYFFWVGIY